MTRTAEHISSSQIWGLGTHRRLPDTIANPFLENACLHNGRGELHLCTLDQVLETKAHLAKTIARRPTDLRLHVERILLHAETSDPDIIGALHDLFRVLGNKGLPLQRRMLTLARPFLSKIDHHRLKQGLEEDRGHDHSRCQAGGGKQFDTDLNGNAIR